MYYEYEKLDAETGKIKYCGPNDDDGSITGHVVIGLKEWYDENPEKRIEHGWTKHIHYDEEKDPEKFPSYNKATQYLLRGTQQIDAHTVEDVYFVNDKSEDQMVLEELLEGVGYGSHIIFN